MRVFSIFYLVLILVVRSESDPCPSLSVEKEKWENEKNLAFSAEKKKYTAHVSALQEKEYGLIKKLEDSKNELLKSDSSLQECSSKTATWKKSAEDAETLVKGLRENEEVLNLKLKQQNSKFTEERKTLERQIAKSAAEVEKLKEQLESKKSAVSEILTEKETASSRLAELEAAFESKSRELESATTMLSEKKNLIASNSKEYEEMRSKLSETNLKFEELINQNAKAVKERELIATKCQKETEVLNQRWEEDLANLKVELMSTRVKHDDEKESLEKKVRLLKEEIQNMTMVEGDILMGGSWLQVPKGWNGRVALDLRLLRNMWDLVWVRVFQLEKLVEVPKQYRKLFLSGAAVMKKFPSLDDLRLHSLSIMATAQELLSSMDKEYTPLLKDAIENVYMTWVKSLGAGWQLYEKVVHPYVGIVSDLVSKLYNENEVGQLYVDPLYEIVVVNTIKPFYVDAILPLYKAYVLDTLDDIPKYRSLVESYAIQIKEYIKANWLLTKNITSVAMVNLRVQYYTWRKSAREAYSTMVVNGDKVFQDISEPLEMFGGKIRFEGGVLEASLVGVSFTLVLWYSSSFVGLAFQFAYVALILVLKTCRFLLVTLAISVVLYMIRFLVVIPTRTVYYTLSLLIRTVVIVVKVLFFPFRVALSFLKCALKLMCCCGFFTCCCKSKTKQESISTNGKVQKKINGKAQKVSPIRKPAGDSSESEGKSKQKKKKSKKGKRSEQKVNGTRISEKKRKKRGKR